MKKLLGKILSYVLPYIVDYLVAYFKSKLEKAERKRRAKDLEGAKKENEVDDAFDNLP